MQSQKMKTGTERFWAAAVCKQKFELFRQDLQFVVVKLSSPLLYGQRAFWLQGIGKGVVIDNNNGAQGSWPQLGQIFDVATLC
jgi:hypothetical protein